MAPSDLSTVVTAGAATVPTTFTLTRWDSLNQDLNIEQWWDQSVPAVLRRGQVSFHNCKTIHGSGPNTAGEPRRVITIHLQPGDNRYTQGKQPDGSLAYHLVDGYCRLIDGVPDYTDPEWFPIVLPSR